MIQEMFTVTFWLMLSSMCVILLTGFTLVIGIEVVDRVYKYLDRFLND